MIGWIEMCLISSCYTHTHTHTHTHTVVGCFYLFNLWFLAENGGRFLIKKQCLVSDPEIKSQLDKEEEPRVQAEEVAWKVMTGVLKELIGLKWLGIKS